MKKIIVLVLLSLAAASNAYDWIGSQWIVNAKISEIRQNDDNVVFAIAPEGSADLGYSAVIGSSECKKSSLAILLAAASNGQRITFFIPGTTTTSIRDVQNITVQVP